MFETVLGCFCWFKLRWNYGSNFLFPQEDREAGAEKLPVVLIFSEIVSSIGQKGGLLAAQYLRKSEVTENKSNEKSILCYNF